MQGIDLKILLMFINTSKVAGWTRAIVAAGFGAAIAKWPWLSQYVDATTQGLIAGAVAGIVVAIWSHVAKAINDGTLTSGDAMKKTAKVLIAAIALAALCGSALAADQSVPPAPAPASSLTVYPNSKCGWFYGIGAMGGAAGVVGAPGGTVQLGGTIEGLAGYACPTASLPWFAQLEIGGQNMSAGNGAFGMATPATFKAELAFQTPLVAIIQAWSGASSAASPTTWLPPGYTVNGAPVAYLGITTTLNDVSANYGIASFHDWTWTPIGWRLGALWDISGPGGKALVADTFIEVDLQSNNICFGAPSCVKTGTATMAGIEVKL
jgi:hypothetical protein